MFFTVFYECAINMKSACFNTNIDFVEKKYLLGHISTFANFEAKHAGNGAKNVKLFLCMCLKISFYNYPWVTLTKLLNCCTLMYVCLMSIVEGIRVHGFKAQMLEQCLIYFFLSVFSLMSFFCQKL